MSDDTRTLAVIDAGIVVNLIVSRGEIPGAVDVSALAPAPAIGWTYDGMTFAAPPAFPRGEALTKREAIADVNQRAGACRAKYLTTVPGQAETYLLKADELHAYDATTLVGASVVETDYPILHAEAQATGASLDETAAIVRATRAAWVSLAAHVEGLRRGAIVAIERATTEVEVVAAIPEVWP